MATMPHGFWLAQVTKQATIKASEEAHETETQFMEANATMATYKASQATWKAAQAGEAAGATESCANQAATEARQARTAEALEYALSAAQYYNEVRLTSFHDDKSNPTWTRGFMLPSVDAITEMPQQWCFLSA